MGKLKDNYNKIKPTDRQIKKQNKDNADNIMFNKMREFLEKKWNNTINYKCVHCLQEAYESELNNTQGYVTDEELIISSNNKLKHK
jgi:hypothetical protein